MTSYRSVSNGSALVETFTSSSGKETLSVYHHDGPALMLTHYCAQGNQVRLRAEPERRARRHDAALRPRSEAVTTVNVAPSKLAAAPHGKLALRTALVDLDVDRDARRLHLVWRAS